MQVIPVWTADFQSWCRKIGRKWYRSCSVFFMLMVPISIGIKLLERTEFMPVVGRALAPLMQPIGLPGEMGLVWATAMLSNIYGSLLVLAGVFAQAPLTVAQVTTLASLILVAHNLLVEVPICGRAGARMLPIFLIRFAGGYLFALILARIWAATGALSNPVDLPLLAPAEGGLVAWAFSELRKYALIAGIVLALIVGLEILERIRIIALIDRLLAPIVRVIGISPLVMPLTLIGMTLGLAYGGGLIVAEANERAIPKKDIFLSLALLSLFHSLIEDTLLMLAIGAHAIGIVVLRLAYSVLLMLGIRKLTDILPERYFVRGSLRDSGATAPDQAR